MNKAHLYEVLGVGPVRVRWAPIEGLRLSDAQEEEAEYRWQRAVEQSGGHLFNGAYFNLTRWNLTAKGIEVIGHFAEYRHFYVHRLAPQLGLNVRAIGVSGITLFDGGGEDYTLAARRGNKMTQYPGLMELVPSGTLDRSCAEDDGVVRAEAKAIEELHEEAKLPFTRIVSADAFAFTHDRADDSYDVCCVLRVNAQAHELRDGINRSDEYTEPEIIRVADLADWAEDLGDQLMPVSKALIEAYLIRTQAPG